MKRKTLKELRKEIVLTAVSGNGGHIASSFSSLEIIWALYQGGVLKINPSNPASSERDIFILSKGHATLALYACLADAGFFNKEELSKYGKIEGMLGGEPFVNIPGVETATGSLGHGLSYGVGMALGFKKNNMNNKVYVLLGDGECQEGSIWEAVDIASFLHLDNLCVIIDNNGLQKMNKVNFVRDNSDSNKRWDSFGWDVKNIDGHNIQEIKEVLLEKNDTTKPRVIIANTIKGKGVSIMENNADWHYKLPNKKEWKIICNELDITEEEINGAKNIY